MRKADNDHWYCWTSTSRTATTQWKHGSKMRRSGGSGSQQIWTMKSIRGVAGQTANHEHEQYDWSETENPTLKQYMEKLTEPGATKMLWDGWFTNNKEKWYRIEP